MKMLTSCTLTGRTCSFSCVNLFQKHAPGVEKDQEDPKRQPRSREDSNDQVEAHFQIESYVGEGFWRREDFHYPFFNCLAAKELRPVDVENGVSGKGLIHPRHQRSFKGITRRIKRVDLPGQ